MNLDPMRISTLRHWKYMFSDKDSNEVKPSMCLLDSPQYTSYNHITLLYYVKLTIVCSVTCNHVGSTRALVGSHFDLQKAEVRWYSRSPKADNLRETDKQPAPDCYSP